MRRHTRIAIVVIIISVVPGRALAAPIDVQVTRLSRVVKPIGPNDLKPPECAALTLTNLVIGTTGTNNADLVLGGPGLDTINGNAGDDCLVGGGGIDTLSGGTGTDVCIGGPALDVFVPLGGCETQIQ